jgi:hypothetical protein
MERRAGVWRRCGITLYIVDRNAFPLDELVFTTHWREHGLNVLGDIGVAHLLLHSQHSFLANGFSRRMRRAKLKASGRYLASQRFLIIAGCRLPLVLFGRRFRLVLFIALGCILFHKLDHHCEVENLDS